MLPAADRPPLQDTIEWPEPTASTPLRVNPPTFRWPASGSGGRYVIALARSPQFQNAINTGSAETFFRPLKPLDPGRWYWRVRSADGAWTRAESFEISPDLPRWEIPDWPLILAQVPSGHPRIYLRPKEVEPDRAKARGPLRDFVREWAQRSAKLIGAESKTRAQAASEPSLAVEDSKERALRKQKLRTWAAKAGSHQLMEGVSDFAWLGMLTGDEKFANEARRRVLAATRMDPRTELTDQASDFANATIVAQSGIAYDMLYDRFSPGERAAVRAMLVARIEPMMARLERSPKRMFQAHAWQRTNLDALIGALAIYGEEPIARQWLEKGLKMFVAFYPWFGGRK
ncbi:MAG: DUF4962 domain-containing protein, partial [Acidobacteria bacterium]|nr:DUF4962 domain-containing protein [Acidobacteriota bacterium]